MIDILDPNYQLPETTARKDEEKTLSERADKIILSDAHTDSDILELCKIKWELTKIYGKALDLATCAEHNYNITRASLTGEGTVTAQENTAKLAAEKKYGNRRNIKSFAQTIRAKIDAINTTCIQYNITQKRYAGCVNDAEGLLDTSAGSSPASPRDWSALQTGRDAFILSTTMTTKVNVLLAIVFGLFVRMGLSLGGSLETDNRPIDYKAQMLQRLKEQNKKIIKNKDSDLKIKLQKLGIHKEFEDVLTSVGMRRSKEVYGKPIKAEYLLAIGLSENMSNYWAVGDSGCSRGAYQMNGCAGKGRWDQVHHGMKFKECSLDPYCSTKRTVDRIFTTYKCNVQDDGTISNWKQCLPKHQGQVPDGRYIRKVIKNGLVVGLLPK